MTIDEIKLLKSQLKEWKEYPLAVNCLSAIETLHSMASALLLALVCVSTAAVAMFVVILLWVLSRVM